jgi:hypothetical protein
VVGRRGERGWEDGSMVRRERNHLGYADVFISGLGLASGLRQKSEKTACSRATLPVFFESMFSSARPPLREFSTTSVVFECAAGLRVVSGCAAGARLSKIQSALLQNACHGFRCQGTGMNAPSSELPHIVPLELMPDKYV